MLFVGPIYPRRWRSCRKLKALIPAFATDHRLRDTFSDIVLKSIDARLTLLQAVLVISAAGSLLSFGR